MPNCRVLIVLLLALTAERGANHVDAAEPDDPVALIGGHLLTQTDAGDLRGDLLIQDGKIAAIGPNVEIPADVRRIDVTGFTVTPGLIDTRSTLWLTTAAAREQASDGRLDVLDGVDPLAEDWREVARQGVTAVYLQPSGMLGGRGAVLAVAPGDTTDSVVIQAIAGGQATLGITGKSATSRDRFAQYEQLKKAFAAAKTYGEQQKKYAEFKAKQNKAKQKSKPATDDAKNKQPTDDAKKQAAGDDATKKPAAASTSKPPTEPTPDPAKNFLLKLLAREIPLRLEAHREDDIAHALKLADEFNLSLVLEGISYPRTQLDQLRQRRTNLVLGPVRQLESSQGYRRGRGEDWLTSLTKDSGRWALATFGEQPRASRMLRVQAAAAVAAGLASDRVLRAITRDAAAILGLADRLGTLAAGQRADIVVFGGDPLDPATPVRLTISQGRIVYESPAVEPPASPPPRRQPAAVSLPTVLPATYAVTSTHILRGKNWRPGRILVRGGKIRPLKSGEQLAADVPLYDLGDAPVTPGLLVAHDSLGAAGTIDDPSDSDASGLQAADAYNPADPAADKLLESGFLRVAFAPGSVNVVAGAVSRVRIGAATPLRGNACAMKFVLSSGARDANRYPASLAGQVDFLRGIFESPGVPLADGADTRLFAPLAVQQTLQETRHRRIASVLRRRTTALFEAHTTTEIRAAIQLIETFKLRGVLVHPDDLSPFLNDLKRLKIGVIARPVRVGDYDRYVDGLAQASAAGIEIAFSSSGGDARMTAALAINAGMSRQAALRGLTVGGTKLLGMADNTSALTPGGPADLVIWNGSPLNLACRPSHVIVDGQLAFVAPPRIAPPREPLTTALR